ncbi:MAG: efflux RND transporter periplasmic adaptor subunit, partial [Gemmatimonadales bacterium]
FGALLIALIGVPLFLSAARRNNQAVEVRMDTVKQQDLVASVTASGRIEAKTSVDVSADITGRITRIAVNEGDLVKEGQFLIQIDPAQYQANVARAEAMLSSSQASLVQARANLDQAERSLARARDLKLAGTALISDEAVEQAETARDVAMANANSAEASVAQAQAGVREAKDNLAKTRLVAPMDGRVVRLAVEEGEVAVPGTFSRETGLLMTIADLSVILANVQVDETDVIRLEEGDSVSVTIDAFPDTTFVGRVTEISNSARMTATETAAGSTDRAVDFDVEVTLENPPEEIRPDLSCTAKIVTETRTDALSIPIIALAVRPHAVVPNESVKQDTSKASEMEDTEGVFVVNDGIATFQPVETGIIGENAFEILSGVELGDSIVTGTYQTIRDLDDSTRVRASTMMGAGEDE